MKVPIYNSRDVSIPGVRFSYKEECTTNKEMYFECTPMGLHTRFQSGDDIVCGVLEGWHHAPCFTYLETHRDVETFVYTDGVALMPFCGIVDGKPDYSTACIVRIEAGTQVEVLAGVGHFVAVAEGDYFRTIVYCPDQPADRISLDEPIEA